MVPSFPALSMSRKGMLAVTVPSTGSMRTLVPVTTVTPPWGKLADVYTVEPIVKLLTLAGKAV